MIKQETTYPTKKMKRVAIIGGDTHSEQVTALSGQTLKIIGVEDSLMRKLVPAGKFPDAVPFSNLNELLAKTKPDIIFVANQNNLRAKTVSTILSRGIHVIVDKPMALNVEELDNIRATLQTSGARLLMLLTLRGDGWYRRVREIVASGEIGVPVQCHSKMSVALEPERRPKWILDRGIAGGLVLDISIHAIDTIEWITGLRFIAAAGCEGHFTHENIKNTSDAGAVFFEMDNGGSAILEHNRILPAGKKMDYRLDIVGTKGQISMRLNESIWLQTEKTESVLTSHEIEPSFSIVENWIESLDGSDPCAVGEEAALRANYVACIAQRAVDIKERLTID